MERIIIKAIEEKDNGVVVVKYNGNREATLNTKWQGQEVDFLKKDVGIAGSVIVEVVEKPNASNPSKPYKNITKVDMASVEKNVEEIVEAKSLETTKETKGSPTTQNSIIAQACMKGAVELCKAFNFTSNEELGEYLCMAANECFGAYQLVLNRLE